MRRAMAILLWLPIVLACLTAGCSWATHDRSVRSVPGESTAGVNMEERTKAVRMVSWAGKSPGETVSAIQPTEVDGVKFGGFKSLRDAAKGPWILVGLGAIVAIGGLAVFLWLDKTKGIAVMAGGGALAVIGIMFEQHPWLSIVIPLIAIAGTVWFIVATKRGKELQSELGLTSKALKQTVDGITAFEIAGTEGNSELNAKLGIALDDDVRSRVPVANRPPQ